ncbi:MAG: rubrerythrin family protein [Thermoflexales bacterium]|nr:rubrerythrin family protein [Thermoflexales bacterium]
MNKMTETNLHEAFAGESQANMKYLNFAQRAEKDGFPNVARLFRAAAYAEQIHASNHLRTLNGIQTTSENLAAGIAGETFEVEQMYPAYIAVAEAQGEKRALRMMAWALEAEKVHAEMYGQAKQSVDAGSDANIPDIWVCSLCGFTVEGEAPDVCPVCGAKHDKFVKF